MMTWEKIPKLFEGRTVRVFGGGPSLGLLEAHRDQLDKVPTIVVNTAMYLHPKAEVLFFSDAWFYWHAKEDIQAFPGLKVTINKCYTDKLGVRRDASLENEPNLYIQPTGSYGWDATRNIICFNRSSGAGAIQLAWHMGAKRIVLFGFDMQEVNGVFEWKSMNRRGDRECKSDPAFFFRKGMETMFQRAGERGVLLYDMVVNATPGSQMKLFPITTVEKGLSL